MISTKDLSGLPNAERLKNFCKGLAALDIIMVEEEWSFIRHYLIANPRGLPKEFVQKELEFRWKLFPEKKEETK